jgi:hypothetical protein
MCLDVCRVAQMDQPALGAEMRHGIHDCADFVHVTVDEEDGSETEERKGMCCRARRRTTSDHKTCE